MLVIYDAIRLDPECGFIAVSDDDWAINPKESYLKHFPTGTVFDIRADDGASEKERLTAMDFSAHLIAIRPGCALPPPEMIEELGRVALTLYFVALGYLKPDEQAEAALAAAVPQAYVC